MEAVQLNGKTDYDRGLAYRAEILPLLDQVCEVLNRAKSDGLIINVGMPVDQFGRYFPQTSIVKPIA